MTLINKRGDQEFGEITNHSQEVATNPSYRFKFDWTYHFIKIQILNIHIIILVVN